MSTYLAFWVGGGMIGLGAAVWVLRRRDALGAASLGGLAVAAVAFAYGAKVQHRLAYMRVTDALVVPPADLLLPGRRLPFGLVLGLAAALAWCRLAGARWRATGDALAVAAAVMQVVGRIGCFVSGCCAGTLSALPWAVRYGPNSEAWMLQRSAGVLPDGASLTLPVHPLPLYFSLASLVLLSTLVALLRRGAPPGSLLLAAVVADPCVRLALEGLRGGLPGVDWAPMLTTIRAWIALDVVVLTALVAARLRRRNRSGASVRLGAVSTCEGGTS